MRSQLPPGFYVCPQVRFTDMLRVGGEDRMSRMAALGKVASKSVDFAVVELASGDVVLVVELDDRSHDEAERRERDAFVNAVLEHSGIPIRRFRPETPIHVRDFFEEILALPDASTLRIHYEDEFPFTIVGYLYSNRLQSFVFVRQQLRFRSGTGAMRRMLGRQRELWHLERYL